MELFQNIDEKTDRIYSTWHENVDDCDDCHRDGRHDERELEFASDCERCNAIAGEFLHFHADMKFTFDQYVEAKVWEKENRFNYKNDVAHLMFDWSTNGKIEFKEAV